MAFQKTNRAETVETVSPSEEAKIAAIKKEAGVTSAADLTEEQRKSLRDDN